MLPGAVAHTATLPSHQTASPPTTSTSTYHEHVSVFCVQRPKTVVISHSQHQRQPRTTAADTATSSRSQSIDDLTSHASRTRRRASLTDSIAGGMNSSASMLGGSLPPQPHRDTDECGSITGGAGTSMTNEPASPGALSKQDIFAFLAGIFATVVMYEFLGRVWLAIIFTIVIASALGFAMLNMAARVMSVVRDIRGVHHEQGGAVGGMGSRASSINELSAGSDGTISSTPITNHIINTN